MDLTVPDNEGNRDISKFNVFILFSSALLAFFILTSWHHFVQCVRS